MPSDRPAALGVVFLFSLALGIVTVAVPLLALSAGYDAAAVGFLVATSAGSQLAVRLSLPRLLGRYSDRSLMALAGATMVLGLALLVVSTSLAVFLLAQACQGAARAILWTSSQTHAVRSGGSTVRRLVDLNLAGYLGTLTGPALGGALAAVSLPLALGTAALAAAGSAAGTTLLHRLPPYDRRASIGTASLLRRPDVGVACWANVVGGTWWSMIGSYVPVILVGAGLGPGQIGLLVSGSEGAGMAAILALRRLPPRWLRRTVLGTGLGALAALAAVALVPAMPAAYVVLLLLGGAAGGSTTTLAPALVSIAAAEHEQGDALSMSGAFRAASLLASPATVGVLLGAVALPVAIAGLTGVLGAAGATIARFGRGWRDRGS
jgi:MFS family permease